MSSQNNMLLKTEKIKSIMLDDKKMDASDIAKKIISKRKKEDYNPPVNKLLDIKSVFERGGVCFYIKPKGREVDNYFMYLHGGGYSFQINKKQWEFVYYLVKKTGYGAVVPIYPLAPEHHAKEAIDMVLESYKSLCERENVNKIVLVGEEAGGSLALSTSLYAWKKGLIRPNKLVLLSPVLDTEFPQKELETTLMDKTKETYRYYYTRGVRDYLNKYWVKDSFGKLELTSPIYADLTDICDEVDIFTIADDLLNGYARKLYDKVKDLQIKHHYFEFYSIVHNYTEHINIPECKMIAKKIVSSIGDKVLKPSPDMMHSVWARSLLAQRYSKIFADNDAIKMAEKIGVQHKKIKEHYNSYSKAVALERVISMDDKVQHFIRRFADGVVVNVGSEIDTMFSRVDNGRIKWYNVDLPERMEIRRTVVESKDREQNIDKSIFDYRWLDMVRKEESQSILFVCQDIMKYFTKDRLKEFLNAIWTKFPGAEVVFDIKNSKGKKLWNKLVKKGKAPGPAVRISIDNCKSMIYDWNIKYKVLSDEPLFKISDLEYIYSKDEAKRFKHVTKRKYDKIIHLRLGTEHFID